MQRMHRIYIEKFNSYEEAKSSIKNLNNKFGGRVKVYNINSYITLPFFKKKYKVFYTIEDRPSRSLKPPEPKLIDISSAKKVKVSIESIVQKTLNLLYPKMKDFLSFEKTSNEIASKFFDYEVLNRAIKAGCISNDIIKEVRMGVAKFIQDTLSPSAPLEVKGERKIIALIGPTGVGKTTTCVKIGAKFFIERIPVSFITLDLFRAGADQQLASFTEHMGIKCNKIVDVSEVSNVMKKVENSKLVIIDTIGTSQKDSEKFAHIKKILDEIKPTDLYLVIPLNYSYDAVMDIIEKFSIFKFNRVIISKADEATEKSYPLLFSVRATVPHALISFITCGQYPQDIVEFQPEKFVEPILSHYFKL